MFAEIKSQWLAALRGGEYKQGTGVLHDITNQEFCCLGVLCDLARKAGVIADPHVYEQKYLPSGAASVNGMVPRNIASYGIAEDRQTEELPAVVALWAGITTGGIDGLGHTQTYPDTNPAITREYYDDDEGYYNTSDTLAELNDGGSTFIEIADLIEEHM